MPDNAAVADTANIALTIRVHRAATGKIDEYKMVSVDPSDITKEAINERDTHDNPA